MTNDKLFNILEYLLDHLEYYVGEGKSTDFYEAATFRYCKTVRNEVFSDEPDGLTFDVIPKIPTEE